MTCLMRRPPVSRERGITLVVVLILMGVIGLTAAAAMRSAITQEKVVNNLRADFAAQTQAEQALRYCEAEVLKLSKDRVLPFQKIEDLPALPWADLNWTKATGWVAPAAATPQWAYLALDASLVPSGGAPSPQCLVERLRVNASDEHTLVITARGYSADYRAGSGGTGASGSTVWLQSFLHFD